MNLFSNLSLYSWRTVPTTEDEIEMFIEEHLDFDRVVREIKNAVYEDNNQGTPPPGDERLFDWMMIYDNLNEKNKKTHITPYFEEMGITDTDTIRQWIGVFTKKLQYLKDQITPTLDTRAWRQTREIELNPGDKVKDYWGHEYEVMEASSDYEEVENYDSTGAMSEMLDEPSMEQETDYREDEARPYTKLYVAVRPLDPARRERLPFGGDTFVFIYGEDGVTKIAWKSTQPTPDIKRGDIVTGWGGEDFEVLDVSNNFEDVAGYDETGVFEETMDPVDERDTDYRTMEGAGVPTLYIAVKPVVPHNDVGSANTYVFFYGPDGVVKKGSLDINKELNLAFDNIAKEVDPENKAGLVSSLQFVAWQEEPTEVYDIEGAYPAQEVFGIVPGGMRGSNYNNPSKVESLLKRQLMQFIKTNKPPVEVISVEFEEFDSGNMSHASAYFNYKVRGRKEDIINLGKLINKYYEENEDDSYNTFLPDIDLDISLYEEGEPVEASLKFVAWRRSGFENMQEEYDVTAHAVHRAAPEEEMYPPRTERINIRTNSLFNDMGIFPEGVTSEEKIKETYESYWNDMGNAPYLVKVIKVEPVERKS